MSSSCPCDSSTPKELDILAGLDALPRQTRSFADVRQALLDGVSQKAALQGWRARNGLDLGLMLLEMWAYISDVLNFYDERIADESYLRTAKRRPSLRRLVELLGYVPTPGGIAGSATIAAIAEGRKRVALPVRTAFRSDAFDDQPPQVFETTTVENIHPFQNEWKIGPLKSGLVRQTTPSQLAGQPGAGRAGRGRFFVFETAGFNLAKDKLALFVINDVGRFARKVIGVKPFTGKDGQSYQEVEINSAIDYPSNTPVTDVRVLTPSTSASPSKSGSFASPSEPIVTGQHMWLDGTFRQLRNRDFVIISNESAGRYAAARISGVADLPVLLPLPPIPSPPEVDGVQPPAGPPPTALVTRVQFSSRVRGLSMKESTRTQLALHFGLVDGGAVTSVGDTELSPRDLAREGGLPVIGFVETPPAAARNNKLQQLFLLMDADEKGALVRGKVRFDGAGRATFQVTDSSMLSEGTYKTPISVFGNLVDLSRGESVVEVLGNGDARQANQRFTLKKKPLTYLETTKNPSGVMSTLSIEVAGKLWTEVKNFFGRGPLDEVYTVRHDDDQNTILTFGDGVRGARLPSGQNNVVARYRFGAGRAAPPANAIQQIARPVPGLRSARSPIAAVRGFDPDPPNMLRTQAPRSVLAFDRAVSVADIEAYALLKPGVLRANAEFVWIESEMRAGVEVTFIGEISERTLLSHLKARVEENLPLQVNKAVARPSVIEIDVVRDDRFDRRLVERTVRRALSDPDNGVLAPIRAEIGGRLWVSPIYAAVQAVEGVIGVRNIVLNVRGISRSAALDALELEALSRSELRRTVESLGRRREIHLAREDLVCTPPGTYFDFDGQEGVRVKADEPAPSLNQLPRHMEEH